MAYSALGRRSEKRVVMLSGVVLGFAAAFFLVRTIQADIAELEGGFKEGDRHYRFVLPESQLGVVEEGEDRDGDGRYERHAVRIGSGGMCVWYIRSSSVEGREVAELRFGSKGQYGAYQEQRELVGEEYSMIRKLFTRNYSDEESSHIYVDTDLNGDFTSLGIGGEGEWTIMLREGDRFIEAAE